MGNLTGAPLDKYVQNQIDIRQKLLGHNPELNSLYEITPDARTLNNHNKGAWVRLVSSVDVTKNNSLKKTLGNVGEGSELAKNFALIGGVGNIAPYSNPIVGGVIPDQDTNKDIFKASKYSYGLGNLEYGLTPIFGIQSVKIRHLNRGAIRKYEIKLEVHNKDQLTIVEALYLRLGYYMLLEWGHTNYIAKNKYVSKPKVATSALNAFFDAQKDTTIESKIFEGRRETEGNYDGALFKVDNYSWSLGKNGGYEITISGVSKGGLVDSLTIGSPRIFEDNTNSILLEDYIIINPPNLAEKTLILEKLGTKIDKEEDIDIFYKRQIGTKLANSEYNALKEAGAIQVKNPNSISSPKVLNLTGAFDGENENLVTTISNQNKSVLNYYLFRIVQALKSQNIPWEEIEGVPTYKKAIVRNIKNQLEVENTEEEIPEAVAIKFSNPSNEENAYESYYVTLGTILSLIKEKIIPQANNVQIKISDGYEDNLMFTHWFQHSTNPQVCLIPFSYGKNPPEGSQPNTGTSSSPNLNTIISNYFRKGDGGNEVYQGRLMAIHVNIEHVTKVLEDTQNDKGGINLYKFLDKLLFTIQEALGNINNFTLTYDDDNGLNIKDDTIIPGVVDFSEDVVALRLYGTLPYQQGSFVRNVSSQSKITNQIATQIAIGSTASGNDVNSSTSLLARWNEGLVDRTQISERLEQALLTGNETPINSESNNEIFEELNKKYATQIEFLNEAYTSFKYLGKSSYTLAETNLQSLLEYDLGVKTLNGSLAGKGFIPIDLSLELDGISGILLYQKLVVTEEILPNSYVNKIDFIVTAMDHSIDRTGWTTTLSTLSTPKPKKRASSAKDSNEFSLLNPPQEEQETEE